MKWAVAIALLAYAVFLLSFPVIALAAPPYITDDPEPTEYQHWEIYLASLFTKQPGSWTSTAPHLEVDYGPLRNVQLQVITPMVLYAPSQGAASYGYGDTQIGIKYRFLEEGGVDPGGRDLSADDRTYRFSYPESWRRALADISADLAAEE